MTRFGKFGTPRGNREQLRAMRRELRVIRPSTEELLGLAYGEGIRTELRVMARAWLRFPGTRSSNVLGRSNALARRRANNKVARASRKANRRPR